MDDLDTEALVVEMRVLRDNILSPENAHAENLIAELEAMIEFGNNNRQMIFHDKTSYIVSIFHALALLNKEDIIPERFQAILPGIKRTNKVLLKLFFSGEMDNYNKNF